MHFESRDISVAGLRAGRGSRVRFPAGVGNFSPLRPKRLLFPPSLLCSGHQGLFPCEWSFQSVGQRMRGAIPPLPHYTFMAWCSVKKNTGSTLPFNLPYAFSLVYFKTFCEIHSIE